MKYFLYTLICFGIITIGCKKKTENLPETLLGNWHTTQETWHKIYPENRSLSTKNEVSKEFFSFKALEISDKRIKIIDPDGDYAHPYYTTEYDNATKSNYIKLGNGSTTIYEYILSDNSLTLKSYSSGRPDAIGPNYSYIEIKLSK